MLLSRKRHRRIENQTREVYLIGRNRKAWREKKKKEKRLNKMIERFERKMQNEPTIKNEYGSKDLTAYNADMINRGRMTIADIKY